MFSASRPTGRSEKGTSGGTAILSRSHLHVVPQALNAAGPREGGVGGLDWTSVVVRLRGVSMAYIAVYMTTGIGLTGENVVKMRQIMVYVMGLEIPYVIMADWNVGPGCLWESGWVQALGGRIVTPRGASHTCSTGSMLDYAVLSSGAAPLFQSLDLVRAPWRSHRGLRMTIRRAPREALARTLVIPKRLHDCPCEDDASAADMEGKVQDTPESFRDTDKAMDGVQRGKQKWKGECHWLKDSHIGIVKERSMMVGEVYRVFSKEAEESLIQGMGLCVEGKKGIRGRGKMPRFRVDAAEG